MAFFIKLLGYLRVIFAVDDIDETLDRVSKRGAQLVGELIQYKEAYRLCYIRGPEGLLIGRRSGPRRINKRLAVRADLTGPQLVHFPD